MKLQKAIDLTHSSQLHSDNVWVSGKRDGILAWADNETPLSSKAGKALVGFDKMNMEIESICAEHSIPFVNGEMYCPNMSFEEIQGTVMSSDALTGLQKGCIKLYVHAIGGAFKNTGAMVDKIHKAFKGAVHIYPVDYLLINKADIDTHYQSALSQGFEGLMLRQPYGHYDQGGLFRMKPVKESDFTVIGYYEGKGRNAGKLGGFNVEGTMDGKPVRSKVGAGISDDLRERLWAAGPDNIGLTLEASFKQVTSRPNKYGFYSLREPVFNKMKLDR